MNTPISYNSLNSFAPNEIPHLHFHTQSPQSATDQKETAPKRTKRRQVKRACTNCHKAHACCSNERPCRRCKQLGLEDSCTDVVRKRRRSRKTKEENTPPAKKPRLDSTLNTLSTTNVTSNTDADNTHKSDQDLTSNIPMNIPLSASASLDTREDPLWSFLGNEDLLLPSPSPPPSFDTQDMGVSAAMSQFDVGATEANWGPNMMGSGNANTMGSQSLQSALFHNALLDNIIATYRSATDMQKQHILSKLGDTKGESSLSSLLYGRVGATTSLPIIVCGLDWSIIEWNKASAQKLSYNWNDLGTRVLNINDLIPNPQFQVLSAQVAATVSAGDHNCSVPTTLHTGKGEMCNMRAEITIVYDNEGSQLCYVAHLV